MPRCHDFSSALAIGYLLMNIFSASANLSVMCAVRCSLDFHLDTVPCRVWLCVECRTCCGSVILFYNKIFAVTFDELLRGDRTKADDTTF